MGATVPKLHWWELLGNYAGALVAAPSEERALELIRTDRIWQHAGPWIAQAADCPGEPTAEGIYHVYGE